MKLAAQVRVRGVCTHSSELEDEVRETVGRVRCVFCMVERFGGGDFVRSGG